MLRHDPSGENDDRRTRPPRARWGVRTLWFLGLAFLSLVASNALHDLRVDYWGLLPLAGALAGVGGAGYCSYRGLREFSWLPR